MKKLCTVLLLVTMILALAWIPAFAAESTTITDADALKAITASGTYQLNSDITLTEKLTIDTTGLDITLDLNQKKLTGQLEISGNGKIKLTGGGTVHSECSADSVPGGATLDTANNASGAATITVNSDATLILEGVTVKGKHYAVYASGTLSVKDTEIQSNAVGIVVSGSANATLENVTVNAENRSLSATVDGNSTDMLVKVISGQYNVSGMGWNDCPVVWDSMGKLVIDGGNFAGGIASAGISVMNGDVTINGGNFTGKDALKTDGRFENRSMKLTVTGGIFEGYRYGLYVSTGADTIVEITVSGGKFSGISKGALQVVATKAPKIALSGGSFDIDSHDQISEYIVENFGAMKNPETGYYDILEHVCKFNKETYNSPASHQRTCVECGKKETEPHQWSEWQTDEDGNHKRTCSVCGYVVSERHRWSQWKDDGGETHSRSCSVCGAIETAEHTYGTSVSLGDGTHEKKCTVCGHKASESCAGDDGTCNLCGAEISEKKTGCGSALGSSGATLLVTLIVPTVWKCKKTKAKSVRKK